MSELLAWMRNALIALVALTLFAGVATQLLTAIFGYAAHFGERTPPWFGFPLYDPWRFLKWGLDLAPVRPWIAFLCILLALTFALARSRCWCWRARCRLATFRNSDRGAGSRIGTF